MGQHHIDEEHSTLTKLTSKEGNIPGHINRKKKNALTALYSSPFPLNCSPTSVFTCPQMVSIGLSLHLLLISITEECY